MKYPVNKTFVERWRAQRATDGAVYRWSWFMPALQDFVSETLSRTGLNGELEIAVAGPAFFEWVRMVEQCEAYAKQQAIDHAHYVCGRLLRCLLHMHPLRIQGDAACLSEQGSSMQKEWPQGYVLMSFVCTLLETYRQQLGAGPLVWDEERFERHWHSFRENVAEDADSAGPFLDFFLGLEPVWEYPTTPSKRRQAARPSC